MLFAVVLLASALATSLSEPEPAEPPERAPELREPKAPAEGRAADDPAEIRFDAGASGRARRDIPQGSRAIVTVRVPAPGQVAIPELGLIADAIPGTPALFDVVPLEADDYEIRFTPAGGDARTVGVLVASAPG